MLEIGRDSYFRVTWQPEVVINVFIGYSGVDLVGKGFEIMFLAPTVLELRHFPCLKKVAKAISRSRDNRK